MVPVALAMAVVSVSMVAVIAIIPAVMPVISVARRFFRLCPVMLRWM
jgi:hypothetical protein